MSSSVVIALWVKTVEELEQLKEKEKSLREELLNVYFNSNGVDLREGTENVELANGYKLKAGFKVNRSLPSDNDKIVGVLNAITNLSDEGEFVAKRIVRSKYELNVTEYRALAPQYRELIDTIITSKPGLPSLDLIHKS